MLPDVKSTSPGELGNASGISKEGMAGSENLKLASSPSTSGDQLTKLPECDGGENDGTNGYDADVRILAVVLVH